VDKCVPPEDSDGSKYKDNNGFAKEEQFFFRVNSAFTKQAEYIVQEIHSETFRIDEFPPQR